MLIGDEEERRLACDAEEIRRRAGIIVRVEGGRGAIERPISEVPEEREAVGGNIEGIALQVDYRIQGGDRALRALEHGVLHAFHIDLQESAAR